MRVSIQESTDYRRSGELARQVLQQLRQQDNPHTHFGFGLNLFHHGLQSATRALRNGENEELVVMALLHDVCEHTVPSGHGPAAALVLGPYLSEENRWILENHEIFQGYYYYELLGEDKNKRDAYRDSPYFDACVRFCELYDVPSFDPDYATEPLSTFEPMVHALFQRKPKQQGACSMME